LYLRTFGGLSIDGAGDGSRRPLGPRQLALLAIVASAGARAITREKILGILWADSHEEQARHALSQMVYRLRRATGGAWVTGTTQLRLDPSAGSDVADFQAALSADRLAWAAELYTGPFLEGFYLAGAPEFEAWLEETRARLHNAARKALETLARRAGEAGDTAAAAGWWGRLLELDPFDAKYAAGRIRALMAAGDPGSALRCALEHESRLRRELEVEPDARIAELIAQLRSMPAPPEPTPPPIPTAPPTPEEPDSPERILETSPVFRPRRPPWVPAILGAGVVIAVALAWLIGGSRSVAEPMPVLAIGAMASRDAVAPGTLLRDMLATNLARVDGLEVVSNSRLLELLPRGSDPGPVPTAVAARRAGASEIIEGELGETEGGLVLTLRRTALRSGLLLQGYTVRARELYALTDSATAAIAQDFGLDPPPDAVASVRTRSAIAYALYEQGLRGVYQGDNDAAGRLMKAALERDSTFAMAAFFAWLSDLAGRRFEEAGRALPRLQRLASRTVDRERLWIEGTIAQREAPVAEFLGIAREMTGRFPNDPDGQILLGWALQAKGDWSGSVAALDRAIAIDSAAGAVSAPYCRVCAATGALNNTYLWWDSAGAAVRTTDRLIRFRPGEGGVWSHAIEPLLRLGRRAEAEAAIEETAKSSASPADFGTLLDRDLIRQGRSDELEDQLVAKLQSTPSGLTGERPWLLAFSLRNQGRLRDARALAADGVVPNTRLRLPTPRDVFTLAAVALEGGQAREAARQFMDLVAADRAADFGTGARSRALAWHLTLAATALAAAGDTATVRALADSVRRIGAGSSFGRDFTLHFFLEGLLLQKQNRHAEAVEAFRRSLFSVTDGFTRVNLEMARSLMALGRYPEAIAILQPVFRGGVDGGNTWVTFTEVHEALAHAFEAARQPDSAAVHYAAVARAWRAADPEFAERYRAALARSAPAR
jgi:DNA-binding SARP family transcriptional activator/tetratricopeptide (TPR) repeat protein